MGFNFRFYMGPQLAVLLWVGIASAASGNRLQITVLVNDSAGVAPSVLSAAEVEAARVFTAAGIEISWVDRLRGSSPNGDARRHVPGSDEFVLHIVPTGKTSTDSVFGEAFLAEDGSGKYTDVFFDRVEDAHRKFGVNVARLLGTVAAHELGHLLLGLRAHSRTGIMTPIWEEESVRKMEMGRLVFTEDQSKLMRRRIVRQVLASNPSRSGPGRAGGF